MNSRVRGKREVEPEDLFLLSDGVGITLPTGPTGSYKGSDVGGWERE